MTYPNQCFFPFFLVMNLFPDWTSSLVIDHRCLFVSSIFSSKTWWIFVIILVGRYAFMPTITYPSFIIFVSLFPSNTAVVVIIVVSASSTVVIIVKATSIIVITTTPRVVVVRTTMISAIVVIIFSIILV